MRQNERIAVLGLWRAGCELVSRMISRKLEGVEFAVVSEDEDALNFCNADKKFLID